MGTSSPSAPAFASVTDGLAGRHVAIATRIYPPDIGAAAFRQERLAHALADAGAHVSVLTSRHGSRPRDAPHPRIRVRRWPVLRDRAGAVRGYLPYASFDVPLVPRLLTLGQPDLIVAEPPPTTGAAVAAVAAARRVPYAYYAADVWSDGAASAAPPWVVGRIRSAERRTLRTARVVLSTSDAITRRLADLGVPADTIATVGNGVDTSVFTPDGSRPSLGRPYVVYAGTTSEWQGVDVFVRALGHVRPSDLVDLVILGDGVDRPRLERLARQVAPGAVRFLEPQPPPLAAAWIRGAVGALASLRPDVQYQSMTPTKIFAAAACGVPVLFAGTGAGADLVRDNHLGITCDHDPLAVAHAIQTLMATQWSAARLARWAGQQGSLESAARRAAGVLSRCVTLAP